MHLELIKTMKQKHYKCINIIEVEFFKLIFEDYCKKWEKALKKNTRINEA